MADEQIMLLRPEEELTSVRKRLEKTQARHIKLVLPMQTQMRSYVSWRLLHARARELGKEILVISPESQIRAVAQAAGFKVAESQGSPATDRFRMSNRPIRGGKPTQAEADHLTHTAQPRRQLGNYLLMRLLGQGGFAQVYLGKHIHLETLAAIKVLFTQLAHDDIEHFRNEARTIAHLKHPHIVRVLEFGIDRTTPFLVMDYAANGTLRQRYPKGTRLPLPTIVSYAKQVASALQYAHDAKMIHRDIKPENMLLGEQQEVLLSDFGIAVVAHSSHSDRTLDTTGTIGYMAPEQIQAHPCPASDQYALGVVVYEWLVGDRPFNGSFTEVAAKHLLVSPSLLRERIPTISLEVEQVVLTALAKDPHQRFATVQAFADALEQASQVERREETDD